MRHDPAVDLWEAERAAGRLLTFAERCSRVDLDDDLLLRSALERQTQIMSAALARLSAEFPAVVASVPKLDKLLELRDHLIHEYDRVDHDKLWATITADIPIVRAVLQAQLRKVSE